MKQILCLQHHYRRHEIIHVRFHIWSLPEQGWCKKKHSWCTHFVISDPEPQSVMDVLSVWEEEKETAGCMWESVLWSVFQGKEINLDKTLQKSPRCALADSSAHILLHLCHSFWIYPGYWEIYKNPIVCLVCMTGLLYKNVMDVIWLTWQ